MTRLFLDCEWADTQGSDLVSIGLVADDGQHSFYSEVSPLPPNPTDFVSKVVYPLLEHGVHSRARVTLADELRTFLTQIPDPFVLYDCAKDGQLFRNALAGFGLPESELKQLPQAPAVVTTLIAERDAVRRQIDQYFIEHPEKAGMKHHALIDAEALRWAFLRLID